MAHPINSSSTSFFQAENFAHPTARGAGLRRLLSRLGGRPAGGALTGHGRARDPVTGLEALEREVDRIRLQSRHWLM